MHDRTPTIVYGELAMNGMMFMALSAPYKLKGLEIWNLGIHLLGSKHKARKGMMVWFGMGINSKPIIYNFKKKQTFGTHFYSMNLLRIYHFMKGNMLAFQTVLYVKNLIAAWSIKFWKQTVNSPYTLQFPFATTWPVLPHMANLCHFLLTRCRLQRHWISSPGRRRALRWGVPFVLSLTIGSRSY